MLYDKKNILCLLYYLGHCDFKNYSKSKYEYIIMIKNEQVRINNLFKFLMMKNIQWIQFYDV